jgi:hypothetical protein
MTNIGYILLAVLGYVALKAFGSKGPTVPFSAGSPFSTIDPNTGAKIINTKPANFVGPIPDQSRIPATDIGNGKMWCPYPFTLYKDLADGKFYCYNDAPAQQTSQTASQGYLLPPTIPPAAGDPSLVLPDVIAQNPAIEPTVSYTVPDTLQAPDYIQPTDTANINPNTLFLPPTSGGTAV